MREIKAEAVTAAVRQLCITANKVLPEDLVQCIGCARRTEPNSTAKSILGDLENNLAAAKELDLPICQDTGMGRMCILTATLRRRCTPAYLPAIRTACCARA